MWHQLLKCNAGETNATTVTASLLGPDDTSTDAVLDNPPDTVALDWRDISCSIYKVGCCQDCLSCLWSYSWLHCSCRIFMFKSVVTGGDIRRPQLSLYLAMPYTVPVSFQAGGQGLQGATPHPNTLCLCLCTWKLESINTCVSNCFFPDDAGWRSEATSADWRLWCHQRCTHIRQ